MKLIIFNQDLRIFDNPALDSCITKANSDHEPILPIFIHDQISYRPIGSASKWFLHHTLKQLNQDLKTINLNNLTFFEGKTTNILSEILGISKITEIFLSNGFDRFQIKAISDIKEFAKQHNIKINLTPANLLFDPQEIKNSSGGYFKVFTPFWKHCLKNEKLIKTPTPKAPKSTTNPPTSQKIQQLKSHKTLEQLNLLPKIKWDQNFSWKFTRQEVIADFQDFLSKKITNYKEQRNFPGTKGTSQLSPYFHFGIISIREIFFTVKQHQYQANSNDHNSSNHFLSEIGWREFSYYLLHHFPNLDSENFQPKFNKFPWSDRTELLKKWQKGQTGYPIVDAGMRELWQTGWMHNRVRMIVASFLIKHLLINWRHGEKWFWDCLVDADLASNTASWQWVAGSGADAAPYFRIFNPILQGQKFDPDGTYIKKWLPELKNLSTKFIHQPWEADMIELTQSNIELGKTYPTPIVNHQNARDMALMAYKYMQ